jgi:hypothetical protein
MRLALLAAALIPAPVIAQVQWTEAEQARIARGQAATATWRDCVKREGVRLARRSRAEAGTLIDAALGLCSAEEVAERALLANTYKVLDDGPARTDAQILRMRAAIRGQAIAAVIEAR